MLLATVAFGTTQKVSEPRAVRVVLKLNNVEDYVQSLSFTLDMIRISQFKIAIACKTEGCVLIAPDQQVVNVISLTYFLLFPCIMTRQRVLNLGFRASGID